MLRSVARTFALLKKQTKMKSKILTALSAIFGLLLINGGLDKFFHYMPTPEDLNPELIKDFDALVEISWLIPLIAAAETIGGALLIFPRTRALGALIVFPVMVGVLLTHIFVDPSQIIIAIVIMFVIMFVDIFLVMFGIKGFIYGNITWIYIVKRAIIKSFVTRNAITSVIND